MSDYVATYVVRQRGAKVDETNEVKVHKSASLSFPPCCDAWMSIGLPPGSAEHFRRCPHCGVVTTAKRVA